MRLTNTDRDAFITAVLDDVPTIDYHEQARQLVQKKAIELMPTKLRMLYKEHNQWFTHITSWGLPSPFRTVRIVSTDDNVTLDQMKADTEFWHSLVQLAEAAKAQAEQIDALEAKLRSCIYACMTAKQAHERMPEFAAYLPADDDGPTRSLPVVANVVSDLVAAGWPKDKKPAKAKPKKAA